MKPKILIASSSFYRFPTKAVKVLDKIRRSYEVVDNPYRRRMNGDEILTLARGCVGIIAGLEEYTKPVLKKLSNDLRCISRDGIGMDNIDLKAAKDYGISVCNTALVGTDAVAELTVGLIISLLRKIPAHNESMHRGYWVQDHGNLLSGKKVGVIGVGNIGRRVARLLDAFGCKVIGNDLKPDLEWFAENNVTRASKNRLYKMSDIITLHASYLPENYHMIDAKSFSRMKKGALFLNLSRGPMVDEKFLTESLRLGRIAGAALDVFEKEPYVGPLSTMDNVILTPHIGASTIETRYQMQLLAIKNLLKILKHGKTRT